MTEPSPDSRLLAIETTLGEVRGELAAQKDHNQRLITTLREARERWELFDGLEDARRQPGHLVGQPVRAVVGEAGRQLGGHQLSIYRYT